MEHGFIMYVCYLCVIFRVTYKAQYEKFKMFHTVLMCMLAVLSLIFPENA